MRSPRPGHRSPWTTCIMWILSAWWRLMEGHKRGDILAMFLGCEAVGVAPSPQGQAGGEAEVSPRGRPASAKRGSQPAWRAEVRESRERRCPDASSWKPLAGGVADFPGTGSVLSFPKKRKNLRKLETKRPFLWDSEESAQRPGRRRGVCLGG